MMNRKERVERNGAGAFLISIDGRRWDELVREASSQDVIIRDIGD